MTSSMFEAALLGTLVVAAHWRGGTPERMITWALLGSYLIDEVYHLATGPAMFQHVDPGHLVIDAVLLACLLWFSLRANRFWPLPVCSLQLIAATAHLAVLAGVPGIRGVYWAMTVVPGWLQYPIVLIGILAHTRRFERIGNYRDWRRGLTAFGGQLIFDQRRAIG